MGVYATQIPCDKCSNIIKRQQNENKKDIQKEIIIKKDGNIIADEVNENVKIPAPRISQDIKTLSTNIEQNKNIKIKKQSNITIIKTKSALNIISSKTSIIGNINIQHNESMDNPIIKNNKNNIIQENDYSIDKKTLKKSNEDNILKINTNKKTFENYNINDIISEQKIHTNNNIEIVFRGYLILKKNKENKFNDNLFGVLPTFSLILFLSTFSLFSLLFILFSKFICISLFSLNNLLLTNAAFLLVLSKNSLFSSSIIEDAGKYNFLPFFVSLISPPFNAIKYDSVTRSFLSIKYFKPFLICIKLLSIFSEFFSNS